LDRGLKQFSISERVRHISVSKNPHADFDEFEAFLNRARGICEERGLNMVSVSARVRTIHFLPLARCVLWGRRIGVDSGRTETFPSVFDSPGNLPRYTYIEGGREKERDEENTPFNRFTMSVARRLGAVICRAPRSSQETGSFCRSADSKRLGLRAFSYVALFGFVSIAVFVECFFLSCVTCRTSRAL